MLCIKLSLYLNHSIEPGLYWFKVRIMKVLGDQTINPFINLLDLILTFILHSLLNQFTIKITMHIKSFFDLIVIEFFIPFICNNFI